MSAINSVTTSLHSSYAGVALTTVTLNGKRYRVSISIEDDQGKTLPMPSRFEEETMKKTEQLILSLFTAHRANGLETHLSSTGIQGANSSGLILQDGKILSHNFTIESCKSNISSQDMTQFASLATEVGKDPSLLRAQDIWDRTQQLILSDQSLKNTLVSSPAPNQSSSPLDTHSTSKETQNPLPIIPPKNQENHSQTLKNPTPSPVVQKSSSSTKIHPLQKLNRLKELAKNPASEEFTDLYAKHQKKYERDKERLGFSSFERYLQYKISMKHKKLLEKKWALENNVRNLTARFYLDKNIQQNDIAVYFEQLKKEPLFDENTFYALIYQDALEQKASIDPHDQKWGEHHALDDVPRFIRVLNSYILTEWAESKYPSIS
jgi:hypothetical protein